MPRPRFHKLEPDKQRAILDAAGREFAEHGYDKASLNAILQALSLSKGAFYYYFDDKADLFATVIEDLEEGAIPDPDALTEASYWPTLERLARESMASMRERSWTWRLGKVFYEVPAEHRADGRLAQMYGAFEAMMRAFIARGQAVGAVRADVPADLVMRLFFAIDRAHADWAADAIDAYAEDELDRIVTASFDMFRRMLSPPEQTVP